MVEHLAYLGPALGSCNRYCPGTATALPPCGVTISRMASSPTAARTFRLTLDLVESGIRLMRQNLRREAPGADEHEIDRKLRTWLHERPGAEHGDSPGRLVDVDARLG